ncbi:acetyltransferase [Bradyrhizobium sp. NFR13]|uniref:bifunctional acetate--CoA ligase family protein/GNAT family N-acetyltransferase n=1 Tax=Bradyrhizobium sp. NFR13 TaxID=1566285 RepID=UPI0008E1142C|nr:bifunctional acetate--CoA ligase family protein/GNAT family N-acetyltransferase [Bradyrhizobium sp. NFR13]SFM11559.1 acetyltransferase [Bradyrhizobium sp. NFR13]
MSTYRLEKLLAPQALALVGASPRPRSLGAAVLRNIRAAGYAGKFGVVNPVHPDIEGHKTFASLDALPFTPDLVVVTAPAAAVPGIIAAAAIKGAAGAVILSAGLGHGANSFAAAALDAAKKGGLRLIGPNCLGLLVPQHRLNASFAAHMPSEGSLALISQSGAIVAAMVDWAARRPVGFSGIVSIGDQLDVDLADCLDYFASDPGTRAILLYLEAIPDARKFMSAARAAARVKPVVVVKAGRMAQGAKAAVTHTGALAGADAVYDAAFRRAGLLRVFDLRELFDCAEVLAGGVEPRGRRLAILTNGGGLGILAVDRLVELGGVPADLGRAVRSRLDDALGGWSGSNPVDVGGDAGADVYRAALDALLDDADNDAVLVMNVQTAVADPVAIARAVADTVSEHRGNGSGSLPKPVLAAFVGADAAVSAPLDSAGIPNFPTEDDAIRAFIYGVHHHESMQTLMATPPGVMAGVKVDRAAAQRVLDQAIGEGRGWLDPLEIAAVFDAYDIPIVPTRMAANVDEAVSLSEGFFRKGHAVVMKILSRDIVHKSDVGGVVLGLRDADAVRLAHGAMMEAVTAKCPDARIAGVIVQPMIMRPRARELIAGLADDSTFGPVVAFGRGGTAVEIINDKALALPPLDMKLADDLVKRTAVARQLAGYRDVPAVKEDAVQMTLLKLSQMAIDLPLIRELDINPLLADEAGVLALDARIAVAVPERLFAGQTRLAIRPFPAVWQRDVVLQDGETVRLRPVVPEDEAAIKHLLDHTDAGDLHSRFLGAIKEFPHPFVARLTQLDYARAMAFAAVAPGSGEILGVSRLHSDSQYRTAEYAVLVRSDRKGHGLGWALMTELIRYAKSEGLLELHGDVLQSNDGMLQMCRALGFQVGSDPEDPAIALVSLDLRAQ